MMVCLISTKEETWVMGFFIRICNKARFDKVKDYIQKNYEFKN